MTAPRRAAFLTGLALAWLSLVEASPAGAHAVGGAPQPTNYRSRITVISPPTPGLTVRLLELGRRVELTNRTADDVVVLGYEGEPYLRVGRGGVYENGNSPTAVQNRARTSGAPATTTTTMAGTGNQTKVADVPPDWRKTSSGRTVRWRDHRTRWEGPDPSVVTEAPDQVHEVSSWQIQLRKGPSGPAEREAQGPSGPAEREAQGPSGPAEREAQGPSGPAERETQAGAGIVVAGRIVWVPGPSAVPWLALVLVLVAATVALAFTASWGWWLSLAVAILVASDVVNTVSSAAASEPTIGDVVLRVLLGGLVSVAAWVVGALAIGSLQRGRTVGLFAAGLSALIVTLYTIPAALTLGRSQLPNALPPAVARAAVATVLGLGLGVLASVVVVFRRNPELLPESNRPDEAPTPLSGGPDAVMSGNGSPK